MQKIAKKYSSSFEIAYKYLQIMLILQGLHITERELQLLSFCAIKGSISVGGVREGFIREFSSSKASVGNMVHRLSKLGLLIKENGRINILPVLSQVDFNNKLVLQLNIGKSDGKA